MTIKGALLVLLTAVMTAAANLLLRGGILKFGSFSLSLSQMKSQIIGLGLQPMFMSGFTLYGAAAVVWFSVLSIENISTSYPVLVGLTFVMVAAGGIFFFHEGFSWQKFSGMLLILNGVVIIAKA